MYVQESNLLYYLQCNCFLEKCKILYLIYKRIVLLFSTLSRHTLLADINDRTTDSI